MAAPADVACTSTSTLRWLSRSTLCAEEGAYSHRLPTPFPSPSEISHDATLNARKLEKNIYPMAAERNNILETDPIYLYRPSPRQYLQSPLALNLLSPAHSSVLLENQYLTGVHSAKDLNTITYKIYIYLSHDVDHNTTILTILTNQLVQIQSAGLHASPEGLDAL